MLTSFVTDNGTFADPEFDRGLLLCPAEGPAKGTDARARGQQYWALWQCRDRLRWMLVSQSLGPLVLSHPLMQLCAEAQFLGRSSSLRRLPALTGK